MMTNITSKLFAFLTCTAMFTCFAKVSAQDVSDDYSKAMSEAGEVADWDINNNGIFDDHEFYVVNYRIWDTDNDGNLNDEEWQAGVDHYVADLDMTDYGSFSDWDTSHDNTIDVNEYIVVMGENDVYGFNESMKENQSSQSDTHTQNIQDATVMIWDEDNDQLVEKIEYGDWSFRFDEDNN